MRLAVQAPSFVLDPLIRSAVYCDTHRHALLALWMRLAICILNSRALCPDSV